MSLKIRTVRNVVNMKCLNILAQASSNNHEENLSFFFLSAIHAYSYSLLSLVLMICDNLSKRTRSYPDDCDVRRMI
ncbi:hypothetical protein SNEBB_000471 [Seison nebaliae]|nr:hypothetical protein SNEBB_000471 [Seison nebaliae]